MTDRVETHYIASRDGYVAYQISGRGAADVLLRSYGMISVDSFDREPHFAEFLARLEQFSRVIRYDVRGVGLSDPIDPSSPPTLEEEVEDAIAVLDATGSERATVFGFVWSGPWAILLAATHPARTSALVLSNTFPRVVRSEDFPYGLEAEFIHERIASITEPGTGLDSTAFHAPSLVGDERFARWWADEGRRGASPRTARALLRRWFLADVRGALPMVQAPTFVFQRERSAIPADVVAMGRYLATQIREARYVEMPGDDNYPLSEGGSELISGELEELLTGIRREPEPDRVLASVLFTDIVSSTDHAASMGDSRWRQVLDRHDAMVRRQFERFGGREVKSTGDGFLATFDGPARGVRCAMAIREGAAQLGIEVRAGVHTGEIELRGNDILGISVHLAQRVSAEAGGGEVLVSRTVKDLVFGSELEFRERGSHELKGIPGRWELFEVVGG